MVTPSTKGLFMKPRQFIGLCSILVLLAGCNKSDSGSSASSNRNEGQGQEITTDPKMELALTIDNAPVTMPLKTLSIYESKPATTSKAAQGFELEGDNAMVAGRLPDGLKLAPGSKFDQLIGKKLSIRRNGGDPAFPKLS